MGGSRLRRGYRCSGMCSLHTARPISRKMMCPSWINATYTCSLSVGECRAAYRANKALHIIARTSLCGLIWTRSRIRIHICGGVGCSMLAFLYTKWGKALCRHFPLRTWSVYGTTVLESLQSYGTTTVCWYLNVFGIEVYALVPKTLNLFTPPSGIIVIFI